MPRTWHSTSVDLAGLARTEGKLQTAITVNELGFGEGWVFATDEEIEALYDWATASTEHLSNPYI
jgi:hypothetical protein